jgi:hypothetical protein
MALPRFSCPESRRAWYHLVKYQAQEPQKQVFGDDANSIVVPRTQNLPLG